MGVGDGAGWLARAGVLQQGAAAAAETLATDLATQLELGRRDGTTVAGVAVDWDKFYDRLHLDTVAQALEAAGMDPEVGALLLDMYRAPRRIVMDGLAGEKRMPSSCTPAGCANAAHIVAISGNARRGFPE